MRTNPGIPKNALEFVDEAKHVLLGHLRILSLQLECLHLEERLQSSIGVFKRIEWSSDFYMWIEPAGGNAERVVELRDGGSASCES